MLQYTHRNFKLLLIERWYKKLENLENDRWVTMSTAAAELGVTLSKISRLASVGRIQTEKDPYDERTKLVNMAELRLIFPPRVKRGSK